MKKVVLIFIFALISGMMFLFVSSCSKKNNMDSALYFKEVYLNEGTKTYRTKQEDGSKSDTLLWCTGKDIKWYNATTGELKFRNSPEWYDFIAYDKLVIFLEDVELFSLETAKRASSDGIHFPCITYRQVRTKGCVPGTLCQCTWEITGEDGSYYISKGYPEWVSKDERTCPISNWAPMDAEREKNWKAIEPAWNLFIEQLKKEGKYKE